jgi:hypothetical protein
VSRRRDEERRQAERRRKIRRIGGWGAVGLAAVVVVAIGVASQLGPAGHGAATPSMATGLASEIDGIRCGTMEGSGYHVHAHLAVFVRGQQMKVPAGIGIRDASVTTTAQGDFVSSGSCFFWLHSHTSDGIIHVEAPEAGSYTLGQYFDIWGKPLSSGQAGDAQGHVVAYVNGQLVTGDPRAIPLVSHAVIQLDVDDSTAPQPYVFAAGS